MLCSVFLELWVGVGDVYDFRVTTGSLKFSAALFPPESNSPCTAEIDSGTEECALGEQPARSLDNARRRKNENALWISKLYHMPTFVDSTPYCFALM